MSRAQNFAYKLSQTTEGWVAKSLDSYLFLFPDSPEKIKRWNYRPISVRSRKNREEGSIVTYLILPEWHFPGFWSGGSCLDEVRERTKRHDYKCPNGQTVFWEEPQVSRKKETLSSTFPFIKSFVEAPKQGKEHGYHSVRCNKLFLRNVLHQ